MKSPERRMHKMSVDWKWLIIGLILGWLVLPRVTSALKG